MKQAKGLDPLYECIGIGSDLKNWMPDSGASSHLTPCLLDLQEVEEGLNLGVEVADGNIVKCTGRGIGEVNMIADDGHPLKAYLHGVIYVPGLKRHQFSVTAFASRGHYAIVRKNKIQLIFGQEERPLTLMLRNVMPVANNTAMEHTGDLLSQFEEGNATATNDQTATTSPLEEDIIHSDLISDPVEDSSEEEMAEEPEDNNEEADISDTVPQVVDDGLDTNTRKSSRTRNPPKLFDFYGFSSC